MKKKSGFTLLECKLHIRHMADLIPQGICRLYVWSYFQVLQTLNMKSQ